MVERLDIKQQLLARVDAGAPRRDPSSAPTRLESRSACSREGRSEDFRRHWIGTHFFNPPRYLRLLELIPTAETDPAVAAAITRFADHHLGKGVVVAKDTPNFIGNHIALYGVVRTLEAIASGRYTIEEIDAITGPALGRPGSATFRTMDIAGIDILAHVMRNLAERLPNEADRAAFAMPAFLQRMLDKGLLGRKSRPRLLRAAEGRLRAKAKSGRSISRRSNTAHVSPRACRRLKRPRTSTTCKSASACCSMRATRRESSCAKRLRRHSSTRRG